MTADPVRLYRLTLLRHNALCHACELNQFTPAGQVRDARARRICAAYWGELERVNLARRARLTAYLKRRDRNEGEQ